MNALLAIVEDDLYYVILLLTVSVWSLFTGMSLGWLWTTLL